MALSAAAQAYKDQYDAYAADKKAQGYVVSPSAVGGGDMDQAFENWSNANVPVADLFALGREFRTNAGKLAKTKKNKSAVIYANPNSTYSLENERGQNKTLLSGSGLDILDQIYAQAQNLSKTGGTKANWRVIETLPDGSTRVLADDDPKSKLGGILDIALPLAGALLMPLTGGLSGALGAAAGSAGGSILSGVVQGKGIGDILKSAAISGGLSYLGGSALGGLGSPGSAVTNAASNAASGGLGSGISAAGNALSSAGQLAGKLGGDIIVQGIKSAVPAAVGGALGAGGGAAAASGLGGGGNTDIVVQGAKNVGASLPGALGSVSGAALTGATNALGGNGSANNEILVEGQKPLSPNIDIEAIASLGVLSPQAIQALQATPEGKSTLEKVSDYLRAAGLISGLAGDLLGGGGGGGQGNGKIPTGSGNLNPIFTAKLPTAKIPGVGDPANLAPRQMPQQDWNTYAMRPEQSFFKYVPGGLG